MEVSKRCESYEQNGGRYYNQCNMVIQSFSLNQHQVNEKQLGDT